MLVYTRIRVGVSTRTRTSVRASPGTCTSDSGGDTQARYGFVIPGLPAPAPEVVRTRISMRTRICTGTRTRTRTRASACTNLGTHACAVSGTKLGIRANSPQK